MKNSPPFLNHGLKGVFIYIKRSLVDKKQNKTGIKNIFEAIAS